jgi:hypothetical protein
MFCECRVEGLPEAERGALGVDPAELLLAKAGTHLVEAVLAVARLALYPPFSRAVKKGLRGAVQFTGPVPVAQIGGEARQAEDRVSQT